MTVRSAAADRASAATARGRSTRRGRPPGIDDTRQRLLDAAASACVEVGFDGVTLAGVARRAGVTPAAVYNHFAGKEDLLYTAGRLAIERLGAATAGATDIAHGARAIVAAFLAPEFRTSRRLILELHLAGPRHGDLADHLAQWHREFATRALPEISVSAPAGDDDPAATVKVLFLLLLGLCHLDDLEALPAASAAVTARVEELIAGLFRRIV